MLASRATRRYAKGAHQQLVQGLFPTMSLKLIEDMSCPYKASFCLHDQAMTAVTTKPGHFVLPGVAEPGTPLDAGHGCIFSGTKHICYSQ